jgi:hypothetical protein
MPILSNCIKSCPLELPATVVEGQNLSLAVTRRLPFITINQELPGEDPHCPRFLLRETSSEMVHHSVG